MHGRLRLPPLWHWRRRHGSAQGCLVAVARSGPLVLWRDGEARPRSPRWCRCGRRRCDGRWHWQWLWRWRGSGRTSGRVTCESDGGATRAGERASGMAREAAVGVAVREDLCLVLAVVCDAHAVLGAYRLPQGALVHKVCAERSIRTGCGRNELRAQPVSFGAGQSGAVRPVPGVVELGGPLAVVQRRAVRVRCRQRPVSVEHPIRWPHLSDWQPLLAVPCMRRRRCEGSWRWHRRVCGRRSRGVRRCRSGCHGRSPVAAESVEGLALVGSHIAEDVSDEAC